MAMFAVSQAANSDNPASSQWTSDLKETVRSIVVGHSDGGIRRAAVYSMMLSPTEAWTPTLVQVMRDDPEAKVRLAAAFVLGNWMDQGVSQDQETYIIESLKSQLTLETSESVKEFISGALGKD